MTHPSMRTSERAATYPRARRIRFTFGEPQPLSKYYAGGDMVFSHFISGLSAAFPPGEESFIRSVVRVAGKVTDPELKRRATGFTAQEATHGREHRKLNAKLVELGYPVGWIDSQGVQNRIKQLENLVPAHLHLAATAAAEHYTTVLAVRVLSKPEIQALAGDAEVRNLLNWHALEEVEHKSVAFDVYRAVGGGETVRIATMVGLLALTVPLTAGGLTAALALDRYARRHPLLVARQARTLFTGPIFQGIAGELARYLRPGFHPDDYDTTELLAHWQYELFGEDGQLVDHLR
ncbi:metal-dependent hydrolase [Nocardia sp. NPDC048505]|uniref:metal-dependent hydrolase n=1 Tax=unclassified Nocardia TaxID=2637762 RepID=UPI00340E8A7D